MTNPQVPNFNPGAGRLATDRFDFQNHVDGYSFRHEASDIDLSPPVLITTSSDNVRDAIIQLKNALTIPLVPDATTVSKGVVQLIGDIGGTATAVSVIAIRGFPIAATPPTLNYVLTWNGSAWAPGPISGSFTFGGDVTGTAGATTVVKINGKPVSATVPNTNDGLIWSGTTWAPARVFPSGTGFNTVTGGTVDVAATANIRYTGGKFQTDTNIQYKNSSITGDLSWTPTSSNKTLTLPNATDTLVGLATTDVLTNKTINATNNTITDTSTALGDILKGNGTKFVRFAKGTALQVLRVNSGGTDLEWAAASGIGVTVSGTGFVTVTSGTIDPNATASIRYTGAGKLQSDNAIQFLNAGVTGDLDWNPTSTNKTLTLPDATDTLIGRATTDTLTNKTFDVAGTGNFLTSTSQATGDLLKNNGTKFVRFAKGSALQVLRVNSGGTDLEFATPASGATSSGASGVVQLSDGAGAFSASTGMLDNGTNVKFSLPVAGNSANSLPFRFKVTRITYTGQLVLTMTAAQYECPIIICSGTTQGGSSYLEVPLSDGGYFCVHNKTDGAIDIRPAGGGSSLDIAVSSKSAIAWYDSVDNKVRGVVSSVLS